MNKFLIGLTVVIGLILFSILALAGSYNGLVKGEEQVRQAWAQVENVYQRRLDLIPNLVETVKGYAAHEKGTFTQVTDARAKAAGSFSPEILDDPSKFSQFQESQQALSGALGRLLVTVENYPQLKANQNFLSLQSQLEGTENRITVERGRYNDAARVFNTRIRQFPSNIVASLFSFRPKDYFKSDSQAQKAPSVKF